jgi:hypothetical protein
MPQIYKFLAICGNIFQPLRLFEHGMPQMCNTRINYFAYLCRADIPHFFRYITIEPTAYFLNYIAMKRKIMTLAALVALTINATLAESFEMLNFGNMDNWITRNIKESSLLGGNTKQVYEIGPTQVDNSGKAYTNRGGSPWGTSNVLASPAGIVKTSNAVYPEDRAGNGKCVKMVTQYEHCKAIGIINIDVIVGGSIFLGQMMEPIKNTSDPYGKMDMGVAFTKRPKALRFDYKVLMPNTGTRIYSSGFGKKKTLAGSDHAEAVVYLQRRWEDKDGNLFANRVGTAVEQYKSSTNGWVNAHDMPIVYGDMTKRSDYVSRMGLMPKDHTYYAKNSKGKLVPVQEVGWEPNGTPTHLILMMSAAGGDAYTGTLGLTMWADNIGFVY